VGDQLGVLASEGVREAVIVPIGFVADHLEVVYDLDHVALGTAASLGLRTARAETPGVDPRFVAMVRALRAAAPVPCPAGCCLPPS
jgi:ferrochelatase